MTKILVVDDEATVRDMVSSMIEPLGCEVTVAGNGLEAIAACKAHAFDLVITDIVMPGKNGIDLIMQLKKDYPSTHVLGISGGGGGITGRYDYLEIAQLVGADNILRKPFSMKDMRDAVSKLLNL